MGLWTSNAPFGCINKNWFLRDPFCSYGTFIKKITENKFIVDYKKRKKNFQWKNRITVWKCRKFALTLYSPKFRESNPLTNKVTKELISRFFFGESKFLNFPHCAMHIYEIYRVIVCKFAKRDAKCLHSCSFWYALRPSWWPINHPSLVH